MVPQDTRGPTVERARMHQAGPTSPLGPSGLNDTAAADHFHPAMVPRQRHRQLLKNSPRHGIKAH